MNSDDRLIAYVFTLIAVVLLGLIAWGAAWGIHSNDNRVKMVHDVTATCTHDPNPNLCLKGNMP